MEVAGGGAAEVVVGLTGAAEVVVGLGGATEVVVGGGAGASDVVDGLTGAAFEEEGAAEDVGAGATKTEEEEEGSTGEEENEGNAPPTLTGAAVGCTSTEEVETSVVVGTETEVEVTMLLLLLLTLQRLLERLRGTTDGATGVNEVSTAGTSAATARRWWRSRAMWGLVIAEAETAKETKRKALVKYIVARDIEEVVLADVGCRVETVKECRWELSF